MENSNKTSPRSLFLAAALLLACTLWIALDALLGLTASARPVTVITPSLVGRPFTDGVLTDKDFFSLSVTYVYDDHTLPRTILSQSPPPGARRKILPGETPCRLALTVSLGKHEVTLPDPRGMDVRAARQWLEARGLHVKLHPVPLHEGDHLTTPTHTVLGMTPAPGQTVPSGHTVTLHAAHPLRDHGTPCPDTVGLTLAAATERLEQAGFHVGEVTYLTRPHIPDPWGIRSDETAGTVASQDKLADTFLPQGTTVSLALYAPNGRGKFAPSVGEATDVHICT